MSDSEDSFDDDVMLCNLETAMTEHNAALSATRDKPRPVTRAAALTDARADARTDPRTDTMSVDSAEASNAATDATDASDTQCTTAAAHSGGVVVVDVDAPIVAADSDINATTMLENLSNSNNNDALMISEVSSFNSSVVNMHNGPLAVYEPPDVDFTNPDPKYHGKIDWLSDEMKALVDSVAPSTADIDDTGCVNKTRSAVEAAKIVHVGKVFRNFIQVRQYIARFALAWGFSVTTAGTAVNCSCAEPNYLTGVKNVTPSKQRKRGPSVKQYKCPFKVSTSQIARYKNEIGPPIAANPVRISAVRFDHTCRPGKAQQLHCHKVSGRYAYLYGGKLQELARTVVGADIETRSLREMLRPYLPADCALSSTDIHNFRLRCLIYLTKLDSDNSAVNALMDGLRESRGLDDSENVALMSDEVGIKAKAILLRTLQDTQNEDFPVAEFLENMKHESVGFDYRMSFSAEGKVNGIVWMTKPMRGDWIRYGDIVQLDAQRKQVNELKWPYIGPVVVTNENTVAVICESLVVSETFDAYKFVMCSLEDMEPRRRLSQVRVVHSDCFLTQEALPDIGLPSAYLVWDHYHLLQQVWKNSIAAQPYSLIFGHLQGMLCATSFVTNWLRTMESLIKASFIHDISKWICRHSICSFRL
jgi:hypothetical protein